MIAFSFASSRLSFFWGASLWVYELVNCLFSASCLFIYLHIMVRVEWPIKIIIIIVVVGRLGGLHGAVIQIKAKPIG